MEYVAINGKQYYFNMDNLFKYVTETRSNEKMVNTTISQVYDPEFDEPHKEVVEAKSSLNETMNNIKYDFIKLLIDRLFNVNYNNQGAPVNPVMLEDMNFAQVMCFNTLIEYKILEEIEDAE